MPLIILAHFGSFAPHVYTNGAIHMINACGYLLRTRVMSSLYAVVNATSLGAPKAKSFVPKLIVTTSACHFEKDHGEAHPGLKEKLRHAHCSCITFSAPYLVTEIPDLAATRHSDVAQPSARRRTYVAKTSSFSVLGCSSEPGATFTLNPAVIESPIASYRNSLSEGPVGNKGCTPASASILESVVSPYEASLLRPQWTVCSSDAKRFVAIVSLPLESGDARCSPRPSI
jgi:hypothetical protein